MARSTLSAPRKWRNSSGLKDARSNIRSAGEQRRLAADLGFIPQFSVNVLPMGVGGTLTLGGANCRQDVGHGRARGDRAQRRQEHLQCE